MSESTINLNSGALGQSKILWEILLRSQLIGSFSVYVLCVGSEISSSSEDYDSEGCSKQNHFCAM